MAAVGYLIIGIADSYNMVLIGLARTYSFTGVCLLVVAIAFLTLRKQIQSFCQNCY
ncbi:MAG: hypothetical protein HC939_07660 [Pleurocapsa sp. SU_5_0]|nr:hypothetical protein [Pleurocapsa sp. SU_5_0]NJR47672.1 hypothetical protein [Hyellaceae cyanobacterium CSU_1_1]